MEPFLEKKWALYDFIDTRTDAHVALTHHKIYSLINIIGTPLLLGLYPPKLNDTKLTAY